jgi:CheY-like chemotaxis protein
MEAIGTLAGGIAHDFNNILTGIQGFSEMLLIDLQPADPMRDQVREILKAVEHAATLTRQLLAFSRKQMIQPVVVNLNKILSNAKGMLGRIIQENIEITYRPSRRSELIRVDPNQINQVLVNLASNAKDAMPKGGSLTFSTSRKRISEGDSPKNLDLAPGEYAILTVKDTGKGMDEETAARAFEPFFTTKGRAEHSGMGLATVFGIVKQNNGAISLESDEAKGTTVTIYFPVASGEGSDDQAQSPATELTGDETILLVEDEEMVRTMAKRFLELKGYTVLDVDNGKEALRISRENIGKIDLLLTDVIMPNMNGRELFERLRPTQPTMKALFMSGYSEEFIAEFGILDEETHFIAKPFKMDDLAQTVRTVLDD